MFDNDNALHRILTIFIFDHFCQECASTMQKIIGILNEIKPN
jgi:hypothetical protein